MPEGLFPVSTRRGKQFNSIVWTETDPLTGAGRDAVYLDPAPTPPALGLADGVGGGAARPTSARWRPRVHLVAAAAPAALQVHWPEGNVLLPGGGSTASPARSIPDYQALVTIEPA